MRRIGLCLFLTGLLILVGSCGGVHRDRERQQSDAQRLAEVLEIESVGDRVDMLIGEFEKSDDPAHNHKVVEHLVAIGSPAVPSLMKQLQGDQNLGARAGVMGYSSRALGKIGAPALGPLLDALDEGQHNRISVIAAIGEMRPPATEAIPVLIAELSNESTRYIAAQSLASMNDAAGAAIPHLVAGLSDPDEDYRISCCRAIQSIDYAAWLEHCEPILDELYGVE